MEKELRIYDTLIQAKNALICGSAGERYDAFMQVLRLTSRFELAKEGNEYCKGELMYDMEEYLNLLPTEEDM